MEGGTDDSRQFDKALEFMGTQFHADGQRQAPRWHKVLAGAIKPHTDPPEPEFKTSLITARELQRDRLNLWERECIERRG
jgi:hypothetical protein